MHVFSSIICYVMFNKRVGVFYHCIGEIIFQNNFVLAEKIKVKVYVNEGKSLSTYKDTTRL